MPLPYVNNTIPTTIPIFQVKPKYITFRIVTKNQYIPYHIHRRQRKVKLILPVLFLFSDNILFLAKSLAFCGDLYYTMNVLITASATKNHKEHLK